MRGNPNLYEINTRVWIKRFGSPEAPATLGTVPIEYWEDLKNKGMDAVWLMGIWKTSEEATEKYCFVDGLKSEYSKALRDWEDEDVIGSPYAIDSYEVNPELGTEADLLELKRKLNSLGIALILDFFPNHFSAESKLLKERPEIFLSAEKKFYEEDPYTFFKPFPNEEKYFAHGRDPFFPAWQDTVQVNYYSDEAREFMINQLLRLTKLADGVRCDMAMLAMNNVFGNTWGGVLAHAYYSKPKEEFWKLAIDIVKRFREDFIFIAEAYWDLEYELQQLGFDFTYDKKLLDRMLEGSAQEVRAHLNAEESYRRKSVRFIENHDEQRAMTSMGKNKSRAAAVIMSTVEGMHLYYDGQFEGKRIKLPVQLGREPVEKPIECIVEHYKVLLEITNEEIFHSGYWMMRTVESAGEGDDSNKNLIAWSWRWLDEKRLVVVNFSDERSRGRIKLELNEYPRNFKLWDLLNHVQYVRETSEVETMGLYVELAPFKAHIFAY